MKKILFTIICLLIVFGFIFISVSVKEKTNLKKVKVAEVTHSIFYAPQYVAHSLGYFKDEGLDVEILLTPGADKVTAAVLSGDVNIGFCGTEATIYVYNNGEKDYLISFAGLTKKDGSFLVSRKEINNFKINELKGKHIIAGRKAGMPAMTLEYAINKAGLKTEDVNFDTSYDFAATSGAFIGGIGDFVALFEPTASSLVKQGYGHIVASIGELGGNVPYTAYNAKRSYIENNPRVIRGFNNAINKGLEYVHNHSAKEIAEVIATYFPDTSINDLEQLVKNYMEIDAWFTDTTITEKDFGHIQEIIKNSNELDKKVPYDKLIKNLNK